MPAANLALAAVIIASTLQKLFLILLVIAEANTMDQYLFKRSRVKISKKPHFAFAGVSPLDNGTNYGD